MEALAVFIILTLGVAGAWGIHQNSYWSGWRDGFNKADNIADRVWRENAPEIYESLRRARQALSDSERTGSSTQPLNKHEQESMNPRVKDTQ